jgi:hypothetical protein
MKKIVVVIVLLIIGGGFILFLKTANLNTWVCTNGSWVKNGNPKASMPTKPCVATTVNSTSTVNPNANIQLLSPKAGDTVGSQFVIRGSAKVFENQLNFRVKNAKGLSLIEGTMVAQAAAAGKFGPFEATVSSVPAGKATIEVFDKSAKDGSEIDKVTIQVTIK